MAVAWPVPRHEPDVSSEHSSRAEQLQDLLELETFYRNLPAIEQHARALEFEYARRVNDAQQARIDAYEKAFQTLIKSPGWHDLREASKPAIAAPRTAGPSPLPRTAPISQLRSERDAYETRLRAALRRVQELIEGERLTTVQVHPYFGSGVEPKEQLDAALAGLRDECARLIGAGKKVVLS